MDCCGVFLHATRLGEQVGTLVDFAPLLGFLKRPLRRRFGLLWVDKEFVLDGRPVYRSVAVALGGKDLEQVALAAVEMAPELQDVAEQLVGALLFGLWYHLVNLLSVGVGSG